ncbi:MAG: PQQ-dependent sugar dehydrogenase, partial [Anaerolineae bacterium]
MSTRMLTAFVVALAGGLLAVCWARCGEAIAAPTPSAMSDVEITVDEILVVGLDHPVQVTHAGDGSGRLFAVEQSGQIRVLRDGVLLPSPLLDLTDRTSRAGERGLLGLAFHPQYQANGYLYVNYTRDTDGATVVTRFTASQSNPDVADPASATEILSIAQPYGNH